MVVVRIEVIELDVLAHRILFHQGVFCSGHAGALQVTRDSRIANFEGWFKLLRI
jgi:hypothetical protein